MIAMVFLLGSFINQINSYRSVYIKYQFVSIPRKQGLPKTWKRVGEDFKNYFMPFSPFLTLYSEKNFRGEAHTIWQAGKYISSWQSINSNEVKSFKVSSTEKVRVVLFYGYFDSIILVSEIDVPDILAIWQQYSKHSGTGYVATSFSVEPVSSPVPVAFEKPNFEGASSPLYGLKYRRLANSGYAVDDRWNPKENDISSIKIPYGFHVTLFTEAEFGGHRARIDNDTAYIGEDINEKIKSIKLTEEVIIYSDKNFLGRSECILPGKYNNSFVPVDFTISSVKVPFGRKIKVYDERDFKGNCAMYEYDTSLTNMNDKIKSFEIEDYIKSASYLQ